MNWKHRIRALIRRQGRNQLTLHWREWPANTARDPVTQARLGAPIERWQTVDALVHEVSAKTMERTFAEIHTGDLVVDMDVSIQLSGLEELRFEVGGRFYVQAELGAGSQSIVDAQSAGVKAVQTVYLRKAT